MSINIEIKGKLPPGYKRKLEKIHEEISELLEGEGNEENQNKVFIAHGHDEAARESVARFVEKLGLRAVILGEQPISGRTIIEQLENHSNADFAIVLFTPDDIGASKSKQEEEQNRARQNVVLELGYFLGKIGRNRVCIICKENVEIPSDYQGVIYIKLDTNQGWKWRLIREFKKAGLLLDVSNLS